MRHRGHNIYNQGGAQGDEYPVKYEEVTTERQQVVATQVRKDFGLATYGYL